MTHAFRIRAVRCLFFLLGLCLFQAGLTQDIDLSGSWKGVLTQRPEGVAAEYPFELYLIQDGEELSGRSYVTYQDYHAELEIEGKIIRGKAVLFQETRFIYSSELNPDLTWCMKTGQLIIKEEDGVIRLEGVWQGKTEHGPCIPGEIKLQRVEPQA